MADDRSSVGDRERDHSQPTATRRELLAALAVGGSTILAGCGYHPGAGEFDWDSRANTGSTGPSWGGSSLSHWLCDGVRLVSIRNQSGRTYDVDEGGWIDYENAGLSVYDSSGDAWSGTIERQYAGTPAVATERVYIPLEDGSVTCLTAGSELDDRTTSPEDRPVETRWTTEPLLERAGDEDGPTLHLAAADGSPLLLVAHADGVFGIDTDTGDRRFVVDLEAGTLEDDSRIAAGRDRAWVATTGESRSTLYGFDFDGNERAIRSLPSTPSWLETAAVSDGGDDLVLVYAGAQLWAVGPDGHRRWSLEVGEVSTRLIVDGERLSLASSDTLTAVDPTNGDRLWERDSPFDDGAVVADARGVYGVRTVSSGFDSEYRLVAITSEGEDWWDVSTHDGVDGVDDVFLVGDRLVLSDGDRLYAFRTSEGSRRTIL
ncbi:PQQ-like beta-propeller repeat protein [Halobacteria archaeon AArc-m2/3/4]|uniref:PQQ-like beta-propeller repeat protein n=1 Tax=Natronoglomus mannanivorans TaxID=2979990 RepID=A0ABT2QHJ0_9EURY|nr:PQQ-like beta-propeller repeat protein [Halobacteria archaeon AArc-m2/3/4]